MAQVRHPRPARWRPFLGARDHHARGRRRGGQEVAGRAFRRHRAWLPVAAGRHHPGRLRLVGGGRQPVLLAARRAGARAGGVHGCAAQGR
ncbi:hypothetical protein G6F63_015026 [Rhizopus arrhizus]|nr:hypothetical protein G6F63_015026 [Rhizopus arrhizus]